MKKLYIPKGETCHYESVESGNIVVDGCLKVDKAVKARHISGHGFIEAGAISARTVTAMDVETAHVVAEKLIAERVCAAEMYISGAVTVSCRLNAQFVEAGKLTVANCEIGELHCDNVVNLPFKHRGLLGTHIASFFRSLWCAWFCREPKDSEKQTTGVSRRPQDASQPAKAARPERHKTTAQAKAPHEDPVSETSEPVFCSTFRDLEGDFEFYHLAEMYRFNKKRGYYMRLFPIERNSAQEPFPDKAEAKHPAA